MNKIISILGGFSDFVGTLAHFVEQFFKSLGAIIGNIPGTVSFLTGAIVSLPTFVSAFATFTIAITIAYFLVGRSVGGRSD